MRRSDHPSRPSAMTCCFFSSLKTLLTLTEGNPHVMLNVLDSTPLAGFQMILIGRFWVIPEGWTTNNPGGSPVHYGIVHYGTDPKNLSQTAKSPIRLNPDHPSTVFRVRIEGLKPGTRYYYTVDSEEANGGSDGVKSSVKSFTIGDPAPQAKQLAP
jgi:hypothetical protein